MIEQVVRILRLAEEEGLRPVLIQVGDRQARELADDLSATWAFKPGQFSPITWMEIMTSRKKTLLGVPLQGVESPDYLHVLMEAPA